MVIRSIWGYCLACICIHIAVWSAQDPHLCCLVKLLVFQDICYDLSRLYVYLEVHGVMYRREGYFRDARFASEPSMQTSVFQH